MTKKVMIDIGRRLEQVGEDLVYEMALRDESLTGGVLMTSLSIQVWPVFIKLYYRAAKRVLASVVAKSLGVKRVRKMDLGLSSPANARGFRHSSANFRAQTLKLPYKQSRTGVVATSNP